MPERSGTASINVLASRSANPGSSLGVGRRRAPAKSMHSMCALWRSRAKDRKSRNGADGARADAAASKQATKANAGACPTQRGVRGGGKRAASTEAHNGKAQRPAKACRWWWSSGAGGTR